MTTLALPAGGHWRRLRRGDRSLKLDAGRVGVRGFDFDVVREGDRALDERALGIEVRERTRARPLNSGTSVVKARVTSITGASSLPSASMLNAIRIVSLFAASTAWAIG